MRSPPRSPAVNPNDLGAIAVIGMSARFPSAPDFDSFAAVLDAGRVVVQRFTASECREDGVPDADLQNAAFVAARAALDDALDFDPEAWGMSLREAVLTDPQQRLLLEAAHASFESAGVVPAQFAGTIGVFAGVGPNTWTPMLTARHPTLAASLGEVGGMIASDKDYAALRIAWKFGLTGPAITVGTACSTSLVAIQMAVSALLSGQCDAALAGGASVVFPARGGHVHQEGHLLSGDGMCRPFDEAAAGTVSGDGAGMVLLRRYADAVADGDPIRAVIRGAAVNNDGARKLGFTAPGADGQAEVVALALALAGLHSGDVGLVQTHGTATRLGDPVELAALGRAFGVGTERAPPHGTIAIGATKANFGHTNGAAGVLAFLASMHALASGRVARHPLYSAPNPELHLDQTPFFVPTATIPFPGGRPRRAGVSAFGVGGTNAHVVVEEAPARREVPQSKGSGPPPVLAYPLSATSAAARERTVLAFQTWLATNPECRPADVAHTLTVGRARRAHRTALVGGVRLDGTAPLDRARPFVLLLPAHGAQRPGLGEAWLNQDPDFQAGFAEVAAIVNPCLNRDLESLVSGAADALLDDQKHGGAALFAVAWGLGRVLAAHGLVPAVAVGHSLGELAAVALAGMLPLEEALQLFLARAEAIDAAPRGAVLHVVLEAEALTPLLPPETWVSLRNAPRATVVTGTVQGIDALEARLTAASVAHRRVRVSFPVHSPLLSGAAPALRHAARGLHTSEGRFPVRSGIDGQLLDAARVADPEHWVRHLVEPANFAAALSACATPQCAWVEAGPTGSVGGLVPLNGLEGPVVSLIPKVVGVASRVQVWGQLWAHGLHDQPNALTPHPGQRIPLPATAFAPVRCDPGALGESARPLSPAASPKPGPGAPSAPRRLARPEMGGPPIAARSLAEARLLSITEELLGVDGIGVEDDFFSLGGDSLITLRLIEVVERETGLRLPAQAAFAGLTVARLAPFLERVSPAPGTHPASPPPPTATPCLMPFRTTGSRPPLFFAHPLTGVVFPYFPLARALGDDQPFYGLQASGLDGQGDVDHSVEAMSARYLKELRAVQPTGPYYVGGYSFGALVAYELARQLRSAGEVVAFCALVDEAAPRKESRPSLVTFLRLFVGQSGKSFVEHFRDYAFLADRSGAKIGAPRKLLERSALAMLLPSDSYQLTLNQPGLGLLFDLLVLHMKATWAYNPPPMDLDVALFKSDWTANPPAWAKRGFDHHLGWDHLVRGRIDVYRCAGDHLGLLRADRAPALALAIRTAMDAAMTREPQAKVTR